MNNQDYLDALETMSITILTKTERIDQWNKWVEQAPKGIKDYFLMIEMDAQRWEIAENQEILTESQLEEVNTIYKEDAS